MLDYVKFDVPRQFDSAAVADIVRGGEGITISLENFGPALGYMVSPYLEREFRVPVRDVTEAVVSRFVAGNFDALNRPSHFLGVWVTDDGATAVFDVSVNIQEFERALVVAREARQEAIWDIVHRDEVFV